VTIAADAAKAAPGQKQSQCERRESEFLHGIVWFVNTMR
jgi:hypothetical protein